MEFEEYCASKKIDADQFKQTDEMLFSELKSIFSEMHVESFTTQKKFLINNLRRRFKLVELKKEVENTISKPTEKKVVIPGVSKSQPKKPATLLKPRIPNK